MTQQQVEKHLALFQAYTTSWVSQDIDAFLSSLDEKVTIIECFGASYYGKLEAKKWFTHWHHNKNNQVIDWHIDQHYFDAHSMTSIFELDFTYRYKGEHRSFSGITVLRVKHNKIVYMKQRKMPIVLLSSIRSTKKFHLIKEVKLYLVKMIKSIFSNQLNSTFNT